MSTVVLQIKWVHIQRSICSGAILIELMVFTFRKFYRTYLIDCTLRLTSNHLMAQLLIPEHFQFWILNPKLIFWAWDPTF